MANMSSMAAVPRAFGSLGSWGCHPGQRPRLAREILRNRSCLGDGHVKIKESSWACLVDSCTNA